MKLKVILNSTGLTLKHISIIFIFPVIFALFYKEYSSIPAFIISGIITFIFGVLFCLNDASEKDIDNITRTEALLIVLSVWGMFALVCAMPFMFFNLSFVDSLLNRYREFQLRAQAFWQIIRYTLKHFLFTVRFCTGLAAWA